MLSYWQVAFIGVPIIGASKIYPATFYNAAVIMLVVGACFVSEARSVANRRVGPASTIRRVADSIGCLAVVALILNSAANDLGGFWRLLQFLVRVPSLTLPWMVWLSLGGLAFLAVISAFRLCVGLAGPMPTHGSTMAVGKEVVWLLVAGGLWVWGAFVPAAWDWGGFGEGINLALKSYYLFVVVGCISRIVLMSGGSLTEKYKKKRNPPIVAARSRDY